MELQNIADLSATGSAMDMEFKFGKKKPMMESGSTMPCRDEESCNGSRVHGIPVNLNRDDTMEREPMSTMMDENTSERGARDKRMALARILGLRDKFLWDTTKVCILR